MLEQSVPDGAGKWRVAPMPTYDGQPATAENGGSAQAVLEQSKNPALAAAFLRWLNHEEGVEPFLESGGFPATVADLQDPAFVAKKSDYFGGQQVNQVLTDAATQVVEGWQYLPYQLYAEHDLRRHRRQGLPDPLRPRRRPGSLAGIAREVRQRAGLQRQLTHD